MYKNPIHIHNCEENHFGDPFILRFNGKYYLYPSTKGGDTGVHCYVSSDLVNFEYAGKVFDDEISECAYAPEVVYYNGEFILCTSPRGNGHYLYKSKSPLGPFTRFTENIKNMIDGSFYVDKNNQLYFLRANHNGISILKMDENGNTYSRNDLDCPMGAWTEGPGLFYFDNLYYLTYTGNNVCSTGYRINYATSKSINHDFKEGKNNPILISTEGKMVRFGHSSNVIGPDLDSIYSIYHELRIQKNGVHLPRRFLVDRFDFNGTLTVVNSSNFNIESPKFPNIYGYGFNDNFYAEQDIYFYNEMFNKFTFEGVIKGSFKFYFNYKNHDEYYAIDVNSKISLISNNGKEKVLVIENNNFDLNYLHTYRVIADSHALEFFIDGALIFRTKLNLIKGRIGLKIESKNNLEFNGITKEAFNSSRKNYDYTIPGMLLLKRSNYIRKDEVDGVNVGKLKINNSISYKTKGNKGKYFITLNASIKDKVKIEINEKIIEITPSNKEFEFNDYVLGEIDLKSSDSIRIKVIEGEIEYKYLNIIKKETYKNTPTIPTFRKLDKDAYQLNQKNTLIKEIEFDLKIKQPHLYQKAGSLFQASNLSDDINQARYPITSMFVGIENNLLVLDYFNYSDKRIYDVPVSLKETNHIKTVINQNNIQVYLNGELKINTNVPYLTGIGRYGLYRSVEADIELKNLQIKEEIYE